MFEKVRDWIHRIKVNEINIFGIRISFSGRNSLKEEPHIDHPVVHNNSSCVGSEHFRSLKMAENSFLEVLLTDIKLERTDKGYIMSVCFNDNYPTIRTRREKEILRRNMKKCQREVEKFEKDICAFMKGTRGKIFEPKEKEYPGLKLRYASGGTLPIVRLGGIKYYCLFYRDIFPIGWNIANGGCDTKTELLYPLDTIERELREEMIIINLNRKSGKCERKGVRYVFPVDLEKPLDHPDFAIARKLWQERFKEYKVTEFPVEKVDIEWIMGPDKVKVMFAPEFFNNDVNGCFINITAEDFGIEIDRVAVIVLKKGDIILDGEISGKQLLNRVVGLFEIDKINSSFEKKHVFEPDHFFYAGKLSSNVKKIKETINKFLQEVTNVRTCQDRKQYKEAKKKKMEFDLCPVTRSIIKRYIHAQKNGICNLP